MIVANYSTKKILKQQVGQQLLYTETSMFGKEYDSNMKGKPVVGPSAYNRKWYAQVWLDNGKIVKVA